MVNLDTGAGVAARLVDGPPFAEPPSAPPVDGPGGGGSDDPPPKPTDVQLAPPDPFADGWPLSFGFNLGRVPGEGEDSDPIVTGGANVGLVGVFDGMGGAGGTIYQSPEGPRTGAYLASRIARAHAERTIVEGLQAPEGLDGAAAARALHVHILEGLQAAAAELGHPKSSLRSKLLRMLPTTMAAAAIQRPDPSVETWTCHLFWAGDSRVYLVDGAGAHQLTLDDIRDHGDAMANLREDSVVSNAISADTPFTINYAQLQISAPALLFAATDGCFGYFRSPMHFERMLLDTLLGSFDVGGWSDLIQREIAAVTGDDASMGALVIAADMDVIQALAATRAAELDKRWVAPMDEMATRVANVELELATLRDREELQNANLWAAYKPAYECFLMRNDLEGRS